MNDFTTWFAELKASNPIWWDALPLAYPKKDYVQLAKECYVHLLSNCQAIIKNKDWERMRNTYQKFLLYGKERVDVEKLPEVEPVVIHPKALTGEQRLAKLKEWEQQIKEAKVVNAVPRMSYAEEAELCGVRRPKDKPYPATTVEELRIKERHLAYVKYCYEPMTGQPNSNWMPEEEFNLQRNETSYRGKVIHDGTEVFEDADESGRADG